MRTERTINILLHAVIGFFFAFFFTRLTVGEFKKFDLKRLRLRSKIALELPAGYAYLLKIWGLDAPESVTFNDNPLIHSILRNRPKIKELYYVLPADLIKRGRNILEIRPVLKHSIRIKNAIGSSDVGIVVLRQGPAIHSGIFKNSSAFYIFCILAFALLGTLSSYVFERVFFPYPGRFSFRCAVSFLPCLLFFFLVLNFNAVMPLQLLFFRRAFAVLFFLIFLIFQGSLFIHFFFREALAKISTNLHQKNEEYPVNKVARWWTSRDFCDRCLIIFVFLLFLSSIFLSLKIPLLASWSGNIAYFFIVAAAVSKLRHDGKDSGAVR